MLDKIYKEKIEPMLKGAEARGIALGEARGEAKGERSGWIKGIVSMAREFGMSDDNIISRLMDKFSVSFAEAEQMLKMA